MPVGDHTHIGGDIFNMGLFEKSYPGANLKRNVPADKLHLNFHRMIMGPVEDSDIAGRHTRSHKLIDSLADEFRLPHDIFRRHQHRTGSRGPDRPERFWKLVFVVFDGQVCQIQNFRRAAVIGFEFENFAIRIAFRKIDNVAEIGPAE